MSDAGWAVLSGVLHLLVVAVVVGPLVRWRGRGRDRSGVDGRGVRVLAGVAVIYLGVLAILHLPRVGFFAELDWNWQNKLLLVVVTVVAVSLWPTISWSRVGVRRPRPRWSVAVLGSVLGAFGVQLLVGPLGSMDTDPETAAYQAIVPGLDEELLFRGVLLFLLDRALRDRRSMWGGQVGWSVVISSLLFGLGHGLFVREGFEVAFHPADVVVSTLIGVLLVWIRIRWDSLWPAVLAHNGWNSSVVAANAVTS